MASAASFPASSRVLVMTTSIAYSLPLRDQLPVDPDAHYLPVLVEEAASADVPRREASELVVDAQDPSGDNCAASMTARGVRPTVCTPWATAASKVSVDPAMEVRR